MSQLDAFFRPNRVAVIGASSNPAKIGGRRFRTLIEGGFKGDVFPINPGADVVQGRRAYASLDEVPGSVDLAIVAVPANAVAQTVSACARKQVPAVMVITAGFGEQNPAGRALERNMVSELAAHGGRMMGPNCAGLYDCASAMNISGMAIPPGPIGLVSQSGNIVLDMVLHAAAAGTGLSRYASVGNSADVRAADVIESLLDDAATEVVVGYVEGLGDGEGRRLYDLARRHPSRKPIVLLKPGRSEEGRSAALSHTGALAGNDRIVDAAFRAAGIWRAASPGEAIDVAAALTRYAPLTSSRIAILTDGGGHATLLADTIGQVGLSLAQFDSATTNALANLLPERCAMSNPIDFAGVAEEQPEIIARTIELCRRAHTVDAVALVGHFGGYHDNGGEDIAGQELASARFIAANRVADDTPLFVQSIHAHRDKPALSQLQSAGITVVRSPMDLGPVLKALTRRPLEELGPHALTVERQAKVIAGITRAGRREQAMLEPEARDVLANSGFAVPRWLTNSDPDQLAALCTKAGLKTVALKLIQPGLLHRSDSGGVMLNVTGPAEIADKARVLLGLAADTQSRDVRVMATAMIAPGIELVFGALRDIHFGPVVMFGLGGIYAETLNDVVFHPAPLNQADAETLISTIAATDMLQGYRGGPVLDVQSAAGILRQLGDLLGAYPEIDEVDLNPVILNDHGLVVADARIILSRSAAADQ